ncbi:cobalt ECF transporter T component CbiQ [Siculibacillus lacustris]|uniref:Cobalt ECF transporter T component CbiQ n=1 Tax=Siculibacillus lacustris TaxID=1549641 RepID=A0A4Q9VXI4_9HYPH|nr:cobalt ECF transporter T component CbiQ [Siculibacillus lacustris]TBW40637.1 cobalt ECF transporter T component CbiQ [Siculibacillus lacustris]
MSDAFVCGCAPTARPSLDRLDARLRVLAVVATVTTILVIRSPIVLAALVPIAVSLARLSGLSWRDLGDRLAHVEGFLVVLAILLPLTVPGPAWIAIGPLALSQPGVDRAILVLLRVNLCAVAILTLLAGLEPVRFGHALARLGVPPKLVHLLLFAARWVALIRAEATRLHEALRARAFRAETSLHTLRTLAHFTGQLLVRAFDRAARVDEAMRCRAFAGRFALVAAERPARPDALFAAGLSLGLALVIAVDRLI